MIVNEILPELKKLVYSSKANKERNMKFDGFPIKRISRYEKKYEELCIKFEQITLMKSGGLLKFNLFERWNHLKLDQQRQHLHEQNRKQPKIQIFDDR